MDTDPSQLILEYLEATLASAPGYPLSNSELCARAGCDYEQLGSHLSKVRKEVEASGRMLCNVPSVGYWISRHETDKINEGLKQVSRRNSHDARLGNTVRNLVDRSHVQTDSDREIFDALEDAVIPQHKRDRIDALLENRLAEVRQRALEARQHTTQPT